VAAFSCWVVSGEGVPRRGAKSGASRSQNPGRDGRLGAYALSIGEMLPVHEPRGGFRPVYRSFAPSILWLRRERYIVGARHRERRVHSRYLKSIKRIAYVSCMALAASHRASAQTSKGVVPPPLHWETLAFDAERARLVLFGGVARVGNEFRYPDQTLEWDGRDWKVAVDSASSPPARSAHAMTYDPRSRRVVLFGGAFEDETKPPAERTRLRCDTWAFDGARWTRLADGPCVTDRPAATSLVHDTRDQSILLLEGPTSPPADTVARPLRIWRLRNNGWTLVDSSGPRRKNSQQAAFDAARSVLVVPVFAGPDTGVWEWDRKTWRRFASSGPKPRDRYAAAYHAGLRRVVMIGGLAVGTRTREWLADAWTWDGARWTELPNNGSTPPKARSHGTLQYDARSGRLLYFGGAGDGGLLFQELWIYDDRGWRQSQP
jgi:hypothetical protein